MWNKTLVVISMVVTMAVLVNAQGFAIGPQIGYFKAMDADEGNLIGGVALRFKGASGFGLEASINYRQEKYANNSLTVRSWPVMVTGLFYPLPIIYGAVGAGWYNTTFDYYQNKLPQIKDKTTQEFGWHFGAGVEIPADETSKFIADIRYVFLNYNFEDIPGSRNLSSNFYIITTGFLFGL